MDNIRKVLDDARQEAFLKYVQAYDFEPRWNLGDTILYGIISTLFVAMVLGVLL